MTAQGVPVVGRRRQMRILTGGQPFAPEAGDPQARAAGVLPRQITGVGHRPALAVMTGRLDGEEAGPVGRGDGRAAELAIAGRIGADRRVLTGTLQVEIEEPDRPLGPPGGEAGEFAGDGRAAFAPIGADELHDPPTARPRRPEGGPKLRHLARQVHHHPNRRTGRTPRLDQAQAS